MFKCAIAWLCAVALLVSAGAARASFHLWQLNEIYSNADGTVQFIELITGVGGQQFLTGHAITSSQGTTTHSFTFPSNLPGDTAGKTFLIGTTGFAALGVVAPDYIVPNGFLFTTNGSVNFAGVDSVSWSALPVDGTLSINRNGVTAINSPKNFAGATGGGPALAPPTCTLTASPSTITGGHSSILRASCSPAATSYAWINTGFASTASGGSVSPTLTTTYSVIGSNAAGPGNSASATVSVTPNCTLIASPGTITGGGSSTLTVNCSPTAVFYAWTNTGFAATASGGSVSPTLTTTYSVIGSNAAGPGNSASATVSVTPNCTLIASPGTITGGGSSTLTVTCSPAATSYAWTNTGFAATAATGTVTPTDTTTYSVIGSNAAGPGNSASATVSVTPNCTLTASPSTITGGQSSTLTVTCIPAATSYAWTNTGFAATAATGTVTPTDTTTYSVIGSNAAGPGNSASATVSVTPNCTLTASPGTITSGGSSTLTATCSPAATSYAWTNAGFATSASSGSVSPTVTTTYSVIGSNTAGAGNSVSATVSVTPNCTLTASPSSITAGQSSTLTATCSPDATSYAWTNTGFATSVSSGTVSPTLTTTYSVIGSNAAGAGNSAGATVSVTTCTYSLSPTSQSVPLGSTNGTLNVTSPPSCAWTASSNVEWITISSGGSGSGNGTVSYAVAANTNGGPRTGTLTVAGQTFTVTQEGITAPTCTLAASASTINFGGSVTLTATCSPAATSYAWAPAAGLVAGPGNTATVTPTAVGDYLYSVTGSNAGGAGNIASTLVTVVPATFTSQSDCLFDWAERTYPDFFAPAGAISADTLPPYYYRYYLQTNAYLGTSSADSHVYYLGPLSNNSILDVGPLSGWLSTAGCQP